MFKLYLIVSLFAVALACGSGEASCNGACYRATSYSCVTDSYNARQMLCPANFNSCNGACYSSSQYHCTNGRLAPGAETNAATSNGATKASTGAAKSTTTSTAKTTSSSGTCTYGNEQNWSGNNFYNQFDFFTAADPTNGFVKFVDRSTAQNMGLISVNSAGQVYMGVDHTNAAPSGRSAVRLSSKTSFTTGLLIIDLAHMPGSVCGSWPAFWTVGSNWPYNGEIDIIEGVNNGETNQVTIHTNSGCTVPSSRAMTGSSTGTNCDVAATGNAGCGVTVNKPNSYGTNFNNAGGGAYVMERSTDAIKVWFFPRGSYPSDLLSGNPNPCSWGEPVSLTPIGSSCPSSHFGPQNVIFDITFCGDWAGAVFGSQCGGDCKSFVANNPASFAESYWLINSVRLLSK